MADDLSSIDTSHIDGLVTIKKAQDEMRTLVEKAQGRKDRVADVVYQRVIGDYEKRIREMEAEARPQREKARAELARLLVLHRRAKEALDKARLDAQEIEFRHDVGEFDDAEFGRRYQVAEEAVTSCLRVFDQSDGLKRRFLEVIPEGTETAPPPPEPEPQPEAAVEAAPERAAGMSAPTPIVAAPVSPADAPTGDGTVAGQAVPALVPEAPGGRKTGVPEESGGFRTVAIAPSVFKEEGSDKVYRLGAITSIGRTPNNQIAIPVREVSRNHAQVVLTETGYVIRDLDSGNGTFVNGRRIKEHQLQDGDRVQVGDRAFIFQPRK